MKLLELTLESAEENLALDEALLESAEQCRAQNQESDCEVLRLWEPKQLTVVVGNASRIDDEVHRNACLRNSAPIVRRPSGGAAVVTGPGCFMYSLVLNYWRRPMLKSVDQAHRFVLETIAAALRLNVPGVRRDGISDLVLENRKFSGNSLRCKREHLLYHGTILHRFPLERLGEFLKLPPREPRYRERRSHEDFVANLPLGSKSIREALVTAFQPDATLSIWPRELTAHLAAEKYSTSRWNDRS